MSGAEEGLPGVLLMRSRGWGSVDGCEGRGKYVYTVSG